MSQAYAESGCRLGRSPPAGAGQTTQTRRRHLPVVGAAVGALAGSAGQLVCSASKLRQTHRHAWGPQRLSGLSHTRRRTSRTLIATAVHPSAARFWIFQLEATRPSKLQRRTRQRPPDVRLAPSRVLGIAAGEHAGRGVRHQAWCWRAGSGCAVSSSFASSSSRVSVGVRAAISASSQRARTRRIRVLNAVANWSRCWRPAAVSSTV